MWLKIVKECCVVKNIRKVIRRRCENDIIMENVYVVCMLSVFIDLFIGWFNMNIVVLVIFLDMRGLWIIS